VTPSGLDLAGAPQGSTVGAPALNARRSATEQRAALVIGNRLPFPLDDGWKLRTYHIVQGLASAGRVTVVTFHAGEERTVEEFRASLDSPVEVFTVRPPAANAPLRLLLGLVTPVPLYVWNQRSAALRRLIRGLAQRQRFDVAVAELVAMYPYLDCLPRETQRVIDTHNIDSLVLRRYATTLPGALRRRYAQVTARKLERYERTVFGTADLTLVCSEPERQVVTRMTPEAHVSVVPNGVDGALLRAHPGVPVDRRRLMFCGLMDYRPNVDAILYFCEQILPQLLAEEPGLELWVVGRSPAREILALAERQPAVRVTGPVPDVSALLATAAVVVVPLRIGGGTRLKILEALALGKPVVSTSIGMEGLELTPGTDLLVADSPPAFANAVRQLLSDPPLASRLGEQGRAAVAKRYQWQRIEETLRHSLAWTTPGG
jgi:polysaccharide biosynthesis protein PslH